MGPRQPSKETLRDSLLPHIRELTQAKFDVRFPADKMIMADDSVAGVKAALDELLQDDEVDLLIAAGAIVAHDVARRGPLPKPVIAAVIFQPQAQGVPLQGDASGVKNLSYISFATDVCSDLQTYRQKPFSSTAMSKSFPLLQAFLTICNRSNLHAFL